MVNLQSLQDEREAILALANGKVFYGTGFGASKKVFGELVFTTFPGAGYNEALTDPSNSGQLYVLTYPLIGNYGVPSWETDEYGIPKYFESDSVKVTGFVVFEACKEPSHFESKKTLDTFLKEQGVPGIEGIDTRHLTKILRTEGVQLGLLWVFEKGEQIPSEEKLMMMLKKAPDPNTRHLVKEVSPKGITIHSPKNPQGTVVLVDCGAKNNIKRSLLKYNLKVVVVPFDASFETVMSYNPNGVVFSNGPGDPKMCVETIDLCRRLINTNIPLMGICLGNQILGLAAGGDTYKLKFGHRGANKPVIYKPTGRCYITSQNHGYAVDEQSVMASGFEAIFINADDKSIEGLIHKEKPIFSSQFHPEAWPGPEDTCFLFEKFVKNMHLKTEV